MEVGFELAHPLVDKVGRAKDGETFDIAAIEQLSCNERGLDGLADADIVGDEQTHRIEFERHEQRNELIGARLDGYLPKPAEWAGTSAQRQQEGVAQEKSGVMSRLLARIGTWERSLSNRLGLECAMNEGLVFL